MPTVETIRPISTPTIALSNESPTRPPRHESASTISAKYSAGPNASAQLARIGAKATMPIVAMMAPMNDAAAEIERAGPARPFLAIG